MGVTYVTGNSFISGFSLGGGRKAAFFALDADLPFLTGLDARIAEMIAPALADMGFDLVRVAVLGRESPTVQIMADRADGTLIAIEDCEQISHAVGAILDVEDPLPGAWTLEVSSAGIDRPLTRAKDWERFAGHLARAEMNMPVDGRKRFSGIVLGARDGHGLMRLDDGTEVALPFADMRKARLVLTDELIEASARMMKPDAASDENGPEEDDSPAGTQKAPGKPDRKPARKAN
ncbi:ribosome maturation protein RimP [Komagataeibacter xylinus NBRC 13693]|uniref:Ribosome maturation factor RimP n=1 Tax=Komagataeibacter xylinus NBRC 13693 TaxID=1234668 RepID=A0A0D6QAH5_KOMXY|nr:ribosome maturation protein RimP [Komagataeibacter xylinus NBRC 13693]